MSAPGPEMVALVALVVPLVWSAALAGLRRSLPSQAPEDLIEKRQLLILIAPAVLGAVLLVLAPLLPTGTALPATGLDDIGRAIVAPAVAAGPVTKAAAGLWLPSLHGLAIAVLIAFAGGAILHAVRLVAALLRLRHVVGTASTDVTWGKDVRITARSVSPLAWGTATVILPQTLLRHLRPERIEMILMHEREHLRRGDTRYFVLLSLIDALFWFNPFVRAQTRRCRLAAELACDAAVTRAAPALSAAYAELLVDALKHVSANMSPTPMPTVFPSEKIGDYHMRLNAILRPETGQPKRRWQYALIALAAMPVAGAQFAWSQTQVSAQPPATAPVTAGPATPVSGLTTAPIDRPMTIPFGARVNPVDGKVALHAGVDFAAPVGTVVKAAGAGTVSAVYSDKNYGKVVEIDHDGTLTRYAHLDTQTVKAGDKVVAGQPIATSGRASVATQPPHLHFEIWKDGKPVDPAKVLNLPNAG